MNSTKTIGILTIVTALGLVSGCSQDDAPGATAGGGANNNLGDSTPTGIVTHRDFQILFDPGNPEIYDADGSYTQKEVKIVISADDVHDLIVSGQIVKFRTEWGSFKDEKDACTLENGECYVTWIPGGTSNPLTGQTPPPGDCLVAFTAWTVGEEKFADINDNGRFDVGESFVDLEEPYLDINSNGQYDSACNVDLVCETIDIVGFPGSGTSGANGVHDLGDGIYNGSLCDSYAGNPQCDSSAKSTMIHTRNDLLIKKDGGTCP